MRQISIQDAKTHLLQLAEDAGAGETIIIAKAGQPIAKLVPLEHKTMEKKPREIGFLDGQFKVPDDFDTMFQDEIIAMFEGRE